jgi:NAD(P)H-dependent flavin oxidoreductase YrpB (nitropropane dioxygenase family)
MVTPKADAKRERARHDRLSPYYRELEIDHVPPSPRLDIAPFGDAMCAVVEKVTPEVVSFHFGLPAPALLARVKAAGCCVMSSATTVEEALWLEARSINAIIAQGCEAVRLPRSPVRWRWCRKSLMRSACRWLPPAALPTDVALPLHLP